MSALGRMIQRIQTDSKFAASLQHGASIALGEAPSWQLRDEPFSPVHWSRPEAFKALRRRVRQLSWVHSRADVVLRETLRGRVVREYRLNKIELAAGKAPRSRRVR